MSIWVREQMYSFQQKMTLDFLWVFKGEIINDCKESLSKYHDDLIQLQSVLYMW